MPEIDTFLETEDALGLLIECGPVLIIDDSKPVRAILRRLLGSLGVKEIVDVSDARAGFSEIQRTQYAIVLCDVEMNEISGIQFLSAVRSNPATYLLPVILITGSRNDRHVAAAKRLNANHFLLKPFTAQGLRGAMLDALSQSAKASEGSNVQEGHSAKPSVVRW